MASLGAAASADPALRLQHALDLAFRSLNRRARTVLELRRFLESRRVDPQTIDEVVAELGEQGYLDDVRFRDGPCLGPERIYGTENSR